MDLVQCIIRQTGLSPTQVVKICSGAPVAYKDFFIPKKSGGMRRISQPARAVKLLQRAVVADLLSALPVHSAAQAYRQKHNIRTNADRHAGETQILKMDFQDFFPSLRAADWRQYVIDNGLALSAFDVELSCRLLFRRFPTSSGLRMAVGAPSSPILSNILMYKFDEVLSKKLADHEISYTRYADDLTFSAPRTGYLNVVKKAVSQTIKEINYPRLIVNHQKTRIATTRYRRTVTGMTLSNDGRVTVGHERKRYIRTGIHKFMQGKSHEIDTTDLAGQLSFIKAVEPEYFQSLEKKYSYETIRQLLRMGGKRPTRS